MASPLANVVEGYATLGSFLVARWRDQATKVATKLDEGTYDADSAVADLAKTAALAAESGFLVASEALDAIAILAGSQAGPHIVHAGPFTSPVAAARLKLAGPLTNLAGSDTLSAVTIEPPLLAAGATQFQLRADATGHQAGTYMGQVLASAGAGPPLPVRVRVIVP